MSRKTFRANSSEINKAPSQVRYIFIVKVEGCAGEMISTCMTYQTLAKVPVESVVYLKAVDLKNDSIINLESRILPGLLAVWRDNYFNHDWDLGSELSINLFNFYIDKQ